MNGSSDPDTIVIIKGKLNVILMKRPSLAHLYWRFYHVEPLSKLKENVSKVVIGKGKCWISCWWGSSPGDIS